MSKRPFDDLNNESSSQEVEHSSVKNTKVKRTCLYRTEWENNYSWLKPIENDAERGFCKLCNSSFKITHGGLNDVKQHDNGKEHKNKLRVLRESNAITKFFCPKSNLPSSIHGNKVAAAELTQVYHNVMHGLSYRSLDCTSKLQPIIFPDSKIAKDITLGRTKASRLVLSVLAPLSIEPVLKKLTENGIFYSIATDAANHGNIKMFPLVIRYYTIEDGLKKYLVDYYEDAKEGSADIFNNIKERLESRNMVLSRISCYSADNANVNFGKFNSVFTKLRMENPRILEARCPAHVVHNAAKYAMGKLEFDLEGLVTKTYNYFASYAKRTNELKDIFDFVEIDYLNLLRHVPTRWLTLYPAIERLLKCYPALENYFNSVGEECSAHVSKYYINEDNDLHGTLITELYLSFHHNVLKIFYDAVLCLEKADLLCIEVFEIMTSLRIKLEQRITDKFFGMKAHQVLRKLASDESNKLSNIFVSWYENALNYLKTRFDFTENNYLNTVQPLNLTRNLTFQDLDNIAEKLQLEIDLDELYEEFVEINPLLQKIRAQESLCLLEKWHKVLNATERNKNLLKIMQFVFSIPGSNAAVERIFSLCKNVWTENRNRMDIEGVKAELQVKCNFNLSCKDFYNFVTDRESILRAAKSDEKYH